MPSKHTNNLDCFPGSMNKDYGCPACVAERIHNNAVRVLRAARKSRLPGYREWTLPQSTAEVQYTKNTWVLFADSFDDEGIPEEVRLTRDEARALLSLVPGIKK